MLRNESNFSKIKRTEEGGVLQKHLYITYGTQCQCNCACCRNQGFEAKVMKVNKNRLIRKILKEAGNFRHIVFGGGEPLMQIKEITELIRLIKWQEFQEQANEEEKIYFSLVTNGERRIFLDEIEEKCRNCNLFTQIVLSRYHYDDLVNEKIFKSKTQLIKGEDLDRICPMLRDKIQLSCLCQKGGVETLGDVEEYLKWAANLNITDVMFSNFQDDVTVEGAKKLGCDLNFLEKAKKMLEEKGFEKASEIVFSAGYKLTKYNGEIPIKATDDLARVLFSILFESEMPRSMFEHTEYVEMNVSFREFISDEKLEKEWEKCNKKTFNYSMMPNGSMYKDWSCKEKE